MMALTMALEKELETYARRLPELLASEGKYVLIHEEEVVETFGTYEDAMKYGYHKFKLNPFLVKKIQSVEHAHFVSRLVPSYTA